MVPSQVFYSGSGLFHAFLAFFLKICGFKDLTTQRRFRILREVLLVVSVFFYSVL